jgi:peroxiredoxin
VQVDPIKPTLKAPGTERLNLKYEQLVSSFCFKFKLRRYSEGVDTVACVSVNDAFVMNAWGKSVEGAAQVMMLADGRGLPSSTFQLNLSRF